MKRLRDSFNRNDWLALGLMVGSPIAAGGLVILAYSLIRGFVR